MFQQLLTSIVLRFQLARELRLRRAVTKLDERLNLKSRFPEHGHYTFGDFDVNRFDSDGGVDLKRFMADHVGKPRSQKYFTMMPDAAKIAASAPQYRKPRIEKVAIRNTKLAAK